MTHESHEAQKIVAEDKIDKMISQNEPKLEATDAPQVQYSASPMMPDMLFAENNAVTLPNPMVNLQMILMNQIKIDLMSSAMSSPLFWNFPDVAATQNMEQHYPTPIWSPESLNGATQTMKDTVAVKASEDNEMINDQENEAPQVSMNPATTKSISQLDQIQNEPTPSKSDQKKCSNCSITKSCQWRNVKSGEGILCNACFIYERKYKKIRPMKAIQFYKKRTINLPSSPATKLATNLLISFPATKLAQGPSASHKTPALKFSINSLLASPKPATQSAMNPLSLFPATHSASATSTPKRRAMDPLSLLASPAPSEQFAQDPTTPRHAKAMQSAMEASSTPTTPKRSAKRKFLEESQKMLQMLDHHLMSMEKRQI
ncbi:unnamed protein product [Caenorhabditis nigoni]|uniref:GATA-type domain-containing protein n=1 Tax=Caenorhabditis nigoni TaxID=1611254 RepID=A0A2G5SAJ4_9PELO|nr:hypothetical protein B9Z55_028653 [Caenorhabditis nigoni]